MTIDEKLEHFYEVSIAEAKEQASGQLDEHKKKLAEMLSEHKKSRSRDAEDDIRAETENARREINKALSAEQITLRRTWSARQNELKEQLFSEVKEQLNSFRSQPRYEDYLCEKVNEARDFAGDDELHIYLSADDSDRLDSMTAKTGFPLEVSPDSFMGGIKATIPAKNILIDNSFLENLQTVFREFKFDGGLNHE